MAEESVVWRRTDIPGHEAARLNQLRDGWELEGSSVLFFEGEACSLSYRVSCDAEWRTRSAQVSGWIGSRTVSVNLSVSASLQWTLNGVHVPGVDGCIDADLNFSPSTNLLPIRRLNLAVGEERTVRAAWLRFPDFHLEPLDQRYVRTGPHRYLYESSNGAFRAELEVTSAGFARRYGDLWMMED